MSGNNFEELLKALDDAAETPVAAAPAMEAEEGEEDEGEGDDAAIAAAAAEGCAKPMKKSLDAGDDDGEAELVDATELVKSLMTRQDDLSGTLAKALTTMTSAIKKQGDLIKSLNDQVSTLSSQGRGRKTVLNVSEKPDIGTLAKSGDAGDGGMSPKDFFAKANSRFDEGKLSGQELNTISVCMRGNHPIDPSLINKVLG